ncbi:MAG: SDR family NAD(P)-dependent oxidoreductase [Actinobacteria bacterium]|nr:SDR family NAD(P)-dependent oxidoreductase [Actinomycetota bacterium]MBU1944260.1 SDR family NAD(P)-dependent oxidoreductase [Actinomycetota bacterium]MBU2688813.1 SDR family NAD(P)-dependent oxidoreductase [Actinomycetota bacterium]
MAWRHAETAVVTGAASGIGRAIAVGLGKKGWRVGVADVDLDGANETVEMVRKAGGEAESFACDVTRPDDVSGMADHFFDSQGKVGLLVNNAGVGGGGDVGEVPIEDWKTVIDTNLWGVIYGCHAFIPRMKEQGGGHILNVASLAGIVPILGLGSYNVTKAGVVALSRTLRMELSPFNISVTALCPSSVKTNIVDNTLAKFVSRDVESLDYGVRTRRTAFEKTPLTVEQVAELALEGVEKDRLYVLTNFFTRLAWLEIRLMPTLYIRLWAWLNRKGLARPLVTKLAEKGIV